MKKSILILFCLVSVFCVYGQSGEKPYVILVSFDGFRHDYLTRFELPAFRRFASDGVRSEGLIPSFPTKTFPNHYTIVTGLYP
ncbi:MAG: alkaline phosphatase family protein, partial [Marivirga sp.]|nr:alkaline phosphatase family protein [Marivirga sp.]